MLPTISGAGNNTIIVFYKVGKRTKANREIKKTRPCWSYERGTFSCNLPTKIITVKKLMASIISLQVMRKQ